MPLGVSFAGFLLSILLKSKKLFFASFSILYIFSLGVTSDFLISYVEKPYEIIPLKDVKKVNSIVVLGGIRKFTEKKQDVTEWHDPDRFFAGIRLFKQGKAKRIIFTDGYNPFYESEITEGILNRRDAISIGVPSSSVFITGRAKNTFQEAKELRKLFDKKKFVSNEIILITSAFHMQRAKRLFERNDFEVLEFPVDFKTKCLKPKLIYNVICFLPNASSLNHSSLALREILGRLIYKIN